MEHNFESDRPVILANDFRCSNCGIIKRVYVEELGRYIYYYKEIPEGYLAIEYMTCSEFLMQQIME